MDNTQEIIDQARRDVVARRAQQARHVDQPWLWAFVGLGLTLILGVLLLPIRGLDYRLQMVVHGVCAQAHYLNMEALRMPLCARNTGIYAGFLGTLLFLLLSGRSRAGRLPPLALTLVLILGAGTMVVDGINSLLLDVGGYNVYAPLNELRLLTGLLMGMALGVFVLLMFNIALRRAPRTEQPVLGSWIEYAALLLVNSGLYLLIFFGPATLYYPLAIFSVAGIVGVLFVANLFVCAMVGGLENRVVHLRQLIRPASVSVVLTGVELALLAGLRMWAESMVPMAM